MAPNPAPASTAPTISPINACDELLGIRKNQVSRFHTIAPNRQATITSRLGHSPAQLPRQWSSQPLRRRGMDPKIQQLRSEPQRCLRAERARRGDHGSHDIAGIMQYTSRKSKTTARIITNISSGYITTCCVFLYHNVCNRIRGFIPTVCSIHKWR